MSEYSRQLQAAEQNLKEDLTEWKVRLKSDIINKLFNTFVSMLDGQIKKIYRHFMKQEKELYVKINSHLHIRSNYTFLSCENILSELNEMVGVSNLILMLENFVGLNCKGIKLILSKFDQQFSSYIGSPIADNYIAKKLEGNNSDLMYLLQYKMIDESSAILDHLKSEIKKSFKRKLKQLKLNSQANAIDFADNISISTNINKGKARKESADSLSSSLLSSDDSFVSEADDSINIIEIKEISKRLLKQLQTNIITIDKISLEFKSIIAKWIYVEDKNKKNKVEHFDFEKTIEGAPKIRHGELLDKLKVKHIKPKNENFELHYRNLIFTFFTTIVGVMSLYTVFPTIGKFIESDLQPSIPSINSVWIVSMSFVGYLFGNSLILLKINSSYKNKLLSSFFILALGNALYCSTSLYSILASRFLIGIALLRASGRDYIVKYYKEDSQPTHLASYQLWSIIGICSSIILSGICMYFTDSIIPLSWICISKHTLAPAILSFTSIVLFFFGIFMIQEPISSNTKKSEKSTFLNITREGLNKDELSMVDDLNNRIMKFNESSRFSDSNLVATTLNNILWQETRFNGFFRTNFFLLCFLSSLAKISFDVFLLTFPLNLAYSNFDKFDSLFNGITLISSFFFVLACTTTISKFTLLKKIKEQTVILVLLTLQTILLILCQALFETGGFFCFLTFFFTLFISLFLDTLFTNLTCKIVPVYFSLFRIPSNYVLSYFIAVSRIVFTLLAYICFVYSKSPELLIFGVFALLNSIAILLVLLNWKNMRIKAITKLISQREKEISK